MSTPVFVPWLLWGGLLFCLLGAAIWEERGRRLGPQVPIGFGLLSLAVGWASEGLGSLETGLLGGLFGAMLFGGVLGLGAAFGRIDRSDAMLAAMIGAALGYPLVVAAMVFTSLVGAGHAVLALFVARVRRANAARKIPYVWSLAGGSLWAMCWQSARMWS